MQWQIILVWFGFGAVSYLLGYLKAKKKYLELLDEEQEHIPSKQKKDSFIKKGIWW